MFIGKILCGIFVFCALSLLLAIIMTICTKPGSIPCDHEWDLPDDQILDYSQKHPYVKQE